MNLKKSLGVIGIVLCVLLLVLATFRVITLRLFWLGLIVLAGFAYFILPRMKD